MQFLKNRRQWLKWVREALCSQEGVAEPLQYPVFAYAGVRSFGYEEFAEQYLYADDVEKMAKKLAEQKEPA